MRYLYTLIFLGVLSPALLPMQNVAAQTPPVIWQRCYGGDSADYIICVKPTPDGGYIAAGTTHSSDGDLSGNGGVKGLWVVKLDGSGNIQWEKTYADTITNGNYVEPTYDGGYIVTGSKTIKLHNDGSIDWVANIVGAVVHQTTDSGYIVFRNSYPTISKLHPDGSVQWQKTFYDTLVNDVCQAFNGGGYIITGSIHDISTDAFIGGLDNYGNPTNFDYPLGHGTGQKIVKTFDSAYLFTIYSGTSYSTSKVNNTLSPVWSTTAIPIGSFAATVDNGIAVWGNDPLHENNLTLNKFDASRNLSWSKTFHGTQPDFAETVFQVANGNYILSGYITTNDSDISGNHGEEDGWIAILGTNTGVQPTAQTPVSIFPNPAYDKLFVELPPDFRNTTIRLIDVYGRTMMEKQNAAPHETLALTGLPPGEYLLNIISDGNFHCYRVVHF